MYRKRLRGKVRFIGEFRLLEALYSHFRDKQVKLCLTMTSCGKKALSKIVWTGFYTGYKLVLNWFQTGKRV